MCLSTVYRVDGTEKTEIAKNVSSIQMMDNGDIVCFDIMGRKTVISGSELKKLDFLENEILVS